MAAIFLGLNVLNNIEKCIMYHIWYKMSINLSM